MTIATLAGFWVGFPGCPVVWVGRGESLLLPSRFWLGPVVEAIAPEE